MKIKIDKQQVGFRIKEIRISKGHTLESFGKVFSATKSNAQKWETGFTLPNKERLANISEMAGITVNELLYGSINEFLENNIEVLLMNSKYPYKSLLYTYNLVELCIEYIEKICSSKIIEISVNDIKSIEQTFNSLLENKVFEILDFIDSQTSSIEIFENEVRSILKNEVLIQAIYCISKSYDYEYLSYLRNLIVHNFRISNKTKKYIVANFDTYTSLLLLSKSNIENKIAIYVFFSYIIHELDYKHSFGMLIKKHIEYMNYETLIKRCENDMEIIFKKNTFYLKSSGYFLNTNKYGLDNYKKILGLIIEKNNILYYLADYDYIEDVPLNTEAQYFILNHDNSYFITKITEKPDCKYLAPILGKME